MPRSLAALAALPDSIIDYYNATGLARDNLFQTMHEGFEDFKANAELQPNAHDSNEYKAQYYSLMVVALCLSPDSTEAALNQAYANIPLEEKNRDKRWDIINWVNKACSIVPHPAFFRQICQDETLDQPVSLQMLGVIARQEGKHQEAATHFGSLLDIVLGDTRYSGAIGNTAYHSALSHLELYCHEGKKADLDTCLSHLEIVGRHNIIPPQQLATYYVNAADNFLEYTSTAISEPIHVALFRRIYREAERLGAASCDLQYLQARYAYNSTDYESTISLSHQAINAMDNPIRVARLQFYCMEAHNKLGNPQAAVDQYRAMGDINYIPLPYAAKATIYESYILALWKTGTPDNREECLNNTRSIIAHYRHKRLPPDSLYQTALAIEQIRAASVVLAGNAVPATPSTVTHATSAHNALDVPQRRRALSAPAKYS